MWDRDLRAQILANFIVCDVEKLVSDHDSNSLQHPLDVLHENFPNLSDDEVVELLNIIIHVYNLKHTEKVDLVATLPSHYKTQALPTISVISDLIDLAKAFSSFYNENKIIGEEKTIKDARVFLTYCVGKTLKEGAHLLGMQVPDKM